LKQSFVLSFALKEVETNKDLYANVAKTTANKKYCKKESEFLIKVPVLHC
jgi:hypothetical protein